MTEINFQKLDELYNTRPLTSVIPANTQSITVQNSDGTYSHMPVSEAQYYTVSQFQDIITDASDIVKASSRSKLLELDLYLMYTKFPSIQVAVEPDLSAFQYILVRNFPLPPTLSTRKGKVKPYKYPFEDFLLVLTGYPAMGPHGVHIKRSSPNWELINKALKDKEDGQEHVYEEQIGGEDLSAKERRTLSAGGWDWLCFHYDSDDGDDSWNFNIRDIRQGDCLAKYFVNLQVALRGEFPDA